MRNFVDAVAAQHRVLGMRLFGSLIKSAFADVLSQRSFADIHSSVDLSLLLTLSEITHFRVPVINRL